MKKQSIVIAGLALGVCFWAGTRFQAQSEATYVGRQVANSPKITEAMVYDDFKQFAKDFNQIRSTEQFHSFVKGLEKNYDELDPSTQLMTLHFNLFPLFRGFTYAVHDVVDSNTALRAQSMSFMREFSKFVAVNKTTRQWDVMFDYLTTPAQTNGRVTHQFKNEVELQAYVCGPVYNKLKDNQKKLKKLNDNFSKFLVIDNKLFQGQDTFEDDSGRFNVIDKPELKFLEYALESSLYDIAFSCMYTVEGAQEVVKKLGKSFGVDAIRGIFTRPDGVSAEKKVEIVKSERKFLTLRAGGSRWAQKAWGHLQASTASLEELADLLLTHKHTEHSIYRREYITPYEDQILDTLEKSKNIFKNKPVALRSNVTGQVVTVNVKKFFDNPEKDLKVFLPTKFVTGPKTLKKRIAGKTVKYENYRFGSPIGWNQKVLKKYIQMEGDYQGDIFLEALRVSKSSWEGLSLATVLGFSLI